MPLDGAEVLRLVAAFSRPGDRPAAAVALARALGGEAFLLFSADPELGIALPAPGLQQTLFAAGEWRTFLDRCISAGEAVGTLPGPDGRPVPARGCAVAGGVVAVLLGEGAEAADLAPLLPALPLLGSLFHAERRIHSVELRARMADEAVGRAGVLTQALQRMRSRLEGALGEAEAARNEAKERAEHAEELADELRMQAQHLEEQTAELEMLNSELEERTEEAERARAAADTANRSKSDFLANMSHELRTPINAVLGYGELLEMELAGPITPGQRVQLERIRSSGRHLLTLISDILDLSKVEAGQMTVEHQAERAGPVVVEACALVQEQYTQRHIALENLCEIPGPPYVGDRDRVRQILLNLLSNAVKFTEPGGRVTVRCATTQHPDEEARLVGTGLWTVIQVEDTGIGIAPEERAGVFQPFVQVDGGRTRTQGGTGLGLTISRQLARLMGGELTLASELGTGSCFSLWLPADAALHGILDESIRVER